MSDDRSEERGTVTPTLLKWVARSFKDKTLNGNSGKTILAAIVRERTEYTCGTDTEVLVDYFHSLGKPSTPRKKGSSRNIQPRYTERTDFSLPEGRPSDIMPWD